MTPGLSKYCGKMVQEYDRNRSSCCSRYARRASRLLLQPSLSLPASERRFDQIDRTFRTDSRYHLHVEIDLYAPVGAARRVVFLLTIFVELIELGGAETEVRR